MSYGELEANLVRENRELREQNRVLRQLVQDVVNSGVAFEDGRIPYKEVQIDRMWFDDAQAALTATSQPVLPYKEWCRHPEKCAGLASCPQDPTCAD